VNCGRGMVATTVLLVRLRMEMVDESALATHADCPSGVTLTATG